jgi:hypothetical protein
LLSGTDTVDLRRLTFEAIPSGGVTLSEGGGPRDLTFRYQHPTLPFGYDVVYTFTPDRYLIQITNRVTSSVTGLDPEVIFTDLGTGIPFNEQKDRDEVRAAAYVVNHSQEGIRSELLSRVDEPITESGPLLWTVVKSKYFIMALMAGSSAEE